MQELLSRCGFRCDLCLAFRSNLETHPANRQLLSDGWYRYFGFRIPADQINCEGCLTKNGCPLDSECLVRPCATERGLPNCGQCQDYPCDKLKSHLVTFEGVAERIKAEIPADERIKFIFPYENKVRLDQINKNRK